MNNKISRKKDALLVNIKYAHNINIASLSSK